LSPFLLLNTYIRREHITINF